jgi:hypothetical protein
VYRPTLAAFAYPLATIRDTGVCEADGRNLDTFKNTGTAGSRMFQKDVVELRADLGDFRKRNGMEMLESTDDVPSDSGRIKGCEVRVCTIRITTRGRHAKCPLTSFTASLVKLDRNPGLESSLVEKSW